MPRLTERQLQGALQYSDVEILIDSRQSSTEAHRQLEHAVNESLERLFLAHWQRNELPPLTPEYRFHPERRWRFDFCLQKQKIAIEIDGGTWTGGRHNRAKGYTKDIEKLNMATALGWTVFRFSNVMLKEGLDAMDAYLKPIKERIDNVTT